MKKTFTCTLCGKCCMGMGRYVTIVADYGGGKVLCRHELGSETVNAVISKEWRDCEDISEGVSEENGWCPFLRTAGEGRYVCAIYDTRPRFCRDFVCCSMRIINSSGEKIGRLKGKASLFTEDQELQELWTREIEDLSHVSESEWKGNVTSILKKNGYKAEWYG